jgi:hypothetical protein
MNFSSACWYFQHRYAIFFSLLIFSIPFCSFLQPADIFNTVLQFSSACWYFQHRFAVFFSLLIFSTPFCSFLQPAHIFNAIMQFCSVCWYFKHLCTIFFSLLIFSKQIIQWFKHKINGQEYNFSPRQINSSTLEWFMPKTFLGSCDVLYFMQQESNNCFYWFASRTLQYTLSDASQAVTHRATSYWKWFKIRAKNTLRRVGSVWLGSPTENHYQT